MVSKRETNVIYLYFIYIFYLHHTIESKMAVGEPEKCLFIRSNRKKKPLPIGTKDVLVALLSVWLNA